MTTNYGLTDAGFIAKRLEDILSDIEADEKTAFGTAIDVSAQSTIGQLNGIFSERVAELWELLEGVYSSLSPDSATGIQQDNVAALTGTVRNPPTLSKVLATCCGTPATLLTAGRVASVATLGYRFVSAADATIAVVSAWIGSHGYSSGDRCTNGGKVFQCTFGGTAAGSGGPSGSTAIGASVTDNAATWLCIGSGTGAVDVQFNAQDSGAKNANAGTLTGIETPVAGWSTVFNIEDHYYLGTALETDASLRLRREQELAAQGNAKVSAIRKKVLAVDSTLACYVFENNTDTTDSDGLPPHSVEVVVLGGDDTAVATAIFESVAAGIQTHGTASATVVDSQGASHTVAFSRPTEVPIYVTLDLTTDPLAFPADGVDQVIAAELLFTSETYTNGSDVIASPLLAQAFSVSGVLDCPLPKIGTAPSPTSSATIPLTLRQIATFDSTRFVVHVS